MAESHEHVIYIIHTLHSLQKTTRRRTIHSQTSARVSALHRYISTSELSFTGISLIGHRERISSASWDGERMVMWQCRYTMAVSKNTSSGIAISHTLLLKMTFQDVTFGVIFSQNSSCFMGESHKYVTIIFQLI